MDVKNYILTLDKNNEKVFNNFCKIIELRPYFVKEELIHYSASYDMISKSLVYEIKFDDSEELINYSASYDIISKSLDCEIKFDDSEEFEVTDGDEDNVC